MFSMVFLLKNSKDFQSSNFGDFINFSHPFEGIQGLPRTSKLFFHKIIFRFIGQKRLCVITNIATIPTNSHFGITKLSNYIVLIPRLQQSKHEAALSEMAFCFHIHGVG